MGKLTLVLGGIRSGKSNYAQRLASRSKAVTYLATGKAVDAEMQQRIIRHQDNRPKSWQTVELNDQNIEMCLKKSTGKTVIIDCVGNLVTDSMENYELKSLIINIETTLRKYKQNFEQMIIVSNEVGLSLVSAHKSGRDFSDAIGLINQKIAEMAEEVYLLVAGQPLKIK